ncbi:enhanced intracellular survival protein Eis [Kibdelosporangium persicum]|uniref:Acetyltransferase n=1 Tax=Kibdelosporangium persicum TaxID=2698649 RepID=A0ABX2FA44_9PSEU|nr:GNAT family N-acetyltransferase [Kibdelosporangium persicum]NRN68241.1 putative acetyltransferase [Kibdelosporangium persicum]
MRIRRLNAEDLADVLTVEYAFSQSPMPEEARAKWRDSILKYEADHLTLAIDEDGAKVAEATAIPMRQNVRGSVLPMAGVAAVAAQPQVRRRGYIRALVTELLGQMRDSGHVLSALYPFRPSFYGKFGFVGMPKPRTARFDPAGLAELVRTELDGTVDWQPIGTGYPNHREITERLLAQRHGFAIFPESRDVRLRDKDDRWIVTAKSGGEVVGAAMYRMKTEGNALEAYSMLFTSEVGRALLLRFFAMHVDQVDAVVVPVAPDELPELWGTDLAVGVEAKPTWSVAPMARVLSVEALAGMAVGPGRVGIEIVDDPFIAGKYMLDGTSGRLEVTSGDPTVTLTAAGFAGLVYGALTPEDVVLRGFGTIPEPGELARLFPRRLPYFFAEF